MQLSTSRWVRIVIALSIVLFMGQNAFGQFGASLQGTVEDSSGNVVPGASVTINNNNTQQTQTQTTGDTGYYRFSELAPGSYNVDITAPNYKKATFSNVNVSAETPRNLDAKLAAGGAAETVTVTAEELPQLQTADASVGGTINQQAIDRLPAAGRDPYELLRLTPGITGDGARSGNGQVSSLPNNSGPGGSNTAIFQTENQVQISAAGQRVSTNNYLIDGVTVDSLEFGGAAVVTPNEESVREITIISSSYSAEDGRNSGAQIKTISKSGTNQWHGSALFKYNSPGLNAFNKFNGVIGNGTLAPRARVQDAYRDWAASIGGPIFHDKLFFFGSYEGVKNNSSNQSNVYLETPELRSLFAASPGLTGQFFSLPGFTPRVVKVLPVVCSDVFGANYNETAPKSLCRTVPGGSGVTALNLGSPYATYGTYVGLSGDINPATGAPYSTGSGLTNFPDLELATIQVPTHIRGNQYNGRIDYQVNTNNLLAGSVYFTKLDNTAGDAASAGRPIGDISFKPLNSAVTLIYIHTFSPTLLNEARANFTRFTENGLKDNANANFSAPRLQVENYPFARPNYGAQQGETTPAIFAENTYAVKDTVTKTLGAKTLRAGIEYRLEQDNNNLLGAARPLYSFSGFFNLQNGTPIFEQIDANPATGGPPTANKYLRTHDIAGFGQFDWKLKPNLTVNIGLRYEYFSPLSEAHGRISNIANPRILFGPGAAVIPKNPFFNASNYNFGPKFGFAWTPNTYHANTVIRGGFGLSYNRLDNVLFSNSRANSGFFRYGICCGTAPPPGGFSTPFAGNQITYVAGATKSPSSYPPNPALQQPINPATGTPTNNTVEIYGAYHNEATPYVYIYSLEVQQQLPGRLVSTLGYQGTIGRHSSRLVNNCIVYGCNDPAGVAPRLFSAVFVPTNDVHSNYNGLNAQLTRRFYNGLQFDTTYTFSKTLDELSAEGPGAQTNQTNPSVPHSEYGPSDYDNTSHFYADALWDLPFLRNRKDMVGILLGHFQLNGIFTARTGFPWTPLVGFCSQANQFADSICPVRPTAVFHQPGTNYSNNAFIKGTNFLDPTGQVNGSFYYGGKQPGPGAYVPAVGRNSLRGPRYKSVDLSVAKDFPWTMGDHSLNFNFRANAFNVFNFENLTPFAFNTNSTNINGGVQFGRPTGGLAGRVLEFEGRFTF
jgi:hypothetical protein